jgi:FkbM family methyltransferase
VKVQQGIASLAAVDHASSFAKIIRLPLRLIPKTAHIRIRTGAAKGLRWVVGSCTHGCWLGTYELEKQRALRHFIKPGMTTYDIGAQAGFYTLLFSRLVGQSGRVYSFEPCAFEMRNLIDHVTINELSNVHVVQAAVAADTGLMAFTVDRGVSQNSLTKQSFLSVSTLRLDDKLFPAPDLIKMDVEGGESAVLAGGRNLIMEHKPVLFIALHGREQHEKCARILSEYGYRITDLAGREIVGVPDTDEIVAQYAS